MKEIVWLVTNWSKASHRDCLIGVGSSSHGARQDAGSVPSSANVSEWDVEDAVRAFPSFEGEIRHFAVAK